MAATWPFGDGERAGGNAAPRHRQDFWRFGAPDPNADLAEFEHLTSDISAKAILRDGLFASLPALSDGHFFSTSGF